MFICEFHKISNGHYFGRTEHPCRKDAEQHAIAELTKLGESEVDIRRAIMVAGCGCADTGYDGYGVRIFEEN